MTQHTCSGHRSIVNTKFTITLSPVYYLLQDALQQSSQFHRWALWLFFPSQTQVQPV